MKRGSQVGKIFFSSPFTWMALLAIVVLEWIFISWFQPPFSLMAGVLGLGVVMLVLWPVFYLRSGAFRRRYQQSPHDTDVAELKGLLTSCSDSFRRPVEECLMLLDNIQEEFPGSPFQSDLERILQNLLDVSRNHAQFYSRLQQFGTSQQQRTMQSVLQQQVRSVENSLTTLKAFSGHLTLLDTHPEDYERIGSDLKTINQELEDVIQEV